MFSRKFGGICCACAIRSPLTRPVARGRQLDAGSDRVVRLRRDPHGTILPLRALKHHMRRPLVLIVALLAAAFGAALIAHAGAATTSPQFRTPDAAAACRLERGTLVCSSLGSVGSVALHARGDGGRQALAVVGCLHPGPATLPARLDQLPALRLGDRLPERQRARSASPPTASPSRANPPETIRGAATRSPRCGCSHPASRRRSRGASERCSARPRGCARSRRSSALRRPGGALRARAR